MIIENYLESHFDMFKHTLIDATGMIIGTIIILLTYKIFVMENKPIIHALKKKMNTKKYLLVMQIRTVNLKCFYRYKVIDIER